MIGRMVRAIAERRSEDDAIVEPWARRRPGPVTSHPFFSAPLSHLSLELAGFHHAACLRWAGAMAAAAAETAPIPRRLLHDYGYRLGRAGRWTALIDIDDRGGFVLTPFDAWPHQGRYTGVTREPDGRTGRGLTVPAADVLHVQLASPPIPYGSSVASIMLELERGVAQDAAIPAGRYITLSDQLITAGSKAWETGRGIFEKNIARGGFQALPPGFGNNQSAALGKTGPAPDEGAVALRAQIREDVEASFGIVGLLSPEAATDVQELWRVAVTSTFEPLLAMLEDEVTAKLEMPVQFDRSGWNTATFDARARAVQRFVASGFERDEALRLAGL